jgi:hypothetical protein
MSITTAAVLAVTAAANISIAAADLAQARFVLANSARVKVPGSWLPGLAILKGAGGLVCFFIGAVSAHIRFRVLDNLAFPGAFLALAAASLALVLTTHC